MGGTVAEINHLFDQAETADLDERTAYMSELAKRIRKWDGTRFESLVRTTLQGGELDITGWKVIAVKAVMIITIERNLTLSFRHGDKVTTIVKYPKTEPMIEKFAEAIAKGAW